MLLDISYFMFDDMVYSFLIFMFIFVMLVRVDDMLCWWYGIQYDVLYYVYACIVILYAYYVECWYVSYQLVQI
jgi:hypothetical protein